MNLRMKDTCLIYNIYERRDFREFYNNFLITDFHAIE